MKKSIIPSLALAALLLAPAATSAGQDDRVERLRERAEFRREMRDLTRERFRARADVRRERMRLKNEFRWHTRDTYRGVHEHYFHAYRDTVREALRETRRALREAFGDRR